jgi:hypothetical protein
MRNYHTQALAGADIFTIMGSIYAEVARYDSAIRAGQQELAAQAVARAEEIVVFAQKLRQLSSPQKMELKKFDSFFLEKVKHRQQSGLDDYLLPFAVAARMRQFS